MFQARTSCVDIDSRDSCQPIAQWENEMGPDRQAKRKDSSKEKIFEEEIRNSRFMASLVLVTYSTFEFVPACLAIFDFSTQVLTTGDSNLQ